MSEQLDQAWIEPRARNGMVALEGEGETWRNRLLRRVDWRFLAGKPHPRCALVAGEGMLAQGLKLVSEQVLPLDQATPGSADLVALVNPNQTALKLAWQALEHGGVLYCEWYIPRPGGPGVLRRSLAELGFLTDGSYWPWPWPERATPAFWLPLDSAGALRYFLESRPAIPSLPARLLRHSKHFIWRLGLRTGLLAPVCIVAYKPLATVEAILPPESLPARSVRWGLIEDGAGMDCLLVTGGLHSTNKVTGLVFQDAASDPSYVIKMPRRRLSLPSLEREARILQAVQAGRKRPLTGIPELIFLDLTETFPAIGETHLAGSPLYTAMQPERLEHLALQSTRWLLNLVKPDPPQPPAAWWERLVEPLLEEFVQGYAAADGRALLEAIRPELEALGSLPLAIEHRDFSPWNVFLTPSGDLSVLDWEGAEPAGMPVSDLVYFLAYLTFFAEGALESGTAPTAYRRMLDPHTRIGAIAGSCFREYCAGAYLQVNVLRPLRLLTWLRHAVLERNLIKASSPGEPDPQLLRRGLFLSLLQTELEMDVDG